MRQFGTFILKEFRHIFRDPRTMLILLGIPVVQIILFGFALSTEVRNVRVAVACPAGDPVAAGIVQRLDASTYFDVAATVADPRQAERLFLEGRADMAIVFSEDFAARTVSPGDAAVELIADASDPNQASMFTAYASAILADYMADQQAAANMPGRIDVQTKMLYNPGMKAAYNFVPGVMGLILMLICAMMTSIAIVREKETGTMEVLLVSPMRPILIILSKAIPYLTLSVVNLCTILVLSVFLLGVPIRGSLALLGLVALVFIAVSLALGLLISTIAKTQIVAMLLSGMVLMMPTMMLSGMVFPVENMPLILQGIAQVIPAKWFIAGVKKVMIEGLGAGSIIPELTILCVMAVLLTVVSLKKFKIRLE